ncbi:Uncharacterised protein [uncultured Megasphaera sp.]|nr:Uncharacterised protein [uncultured Megasphaera sp.]SCJ58183.1 Uncharacterised protein [uncultured Ruminococcus sp.]
MRPATLIGIASLCRTEGYSQLLIFFGHILNFTCRRHRISSRHLAVFVAQVAVDGHIRAAADDAGIRRLDNIFRCLGMGTYNGIRIDLLAIGNAKRRIMLFCFGVVLRNLSLQLFQKRIKTGIPVRLGHAGFFRPGRRHRRQPECFKNRVIPIIVGNFRPYWISRICRFSRPRFFNDIISRLVNFHRIRVMIGAVAAA